MHIHADFTQPAFVHPSAHQWVASPQPGVERILLERRGAESGLATSIVRYAPHSRFPSHRHPGGEEILVLSGVFSEGAQHYPPGWYLRNPVGSCHAPHCAPGAEIFVKLGHLQPCDSTAVCTAVRIDTHDAQRWVTDGPHAVCHLYSDAHEHTRLVRLPALGLLPVAIAQQTEALVLQGHLQHDGTTLPERGWLRMPPGQTAPWRAGGLGATVFLKTTKPVTVPVIPGTD